MSANFTLSGTENLLKILREYPDMGYRKPISAAFRAASVPVKKAIIACMPGYLGGLVKSVKAMSSRASKGEPSLAVGIFGGKSLSYRNSRGIDWDPWVVAYWHNYGTMAYRSSSHSFTTARKAKTAGRKGGIKPLLFVERGWEQSSAEAEKVFEVKYEKDVTKFLSENAYKG